MLWKTDLHVHTNASKCSNLEADKIFDTCKKQKIHTIAITDHNTISGALKLQRKAPKNLQIIIGEEITTTHGDIIGLFLSQEIPSKLSPKETIKQIKKQGGIVMIPHPADSLRREAFGLQNLESIVQDIDLIEVHNARNLFPWNNYQAKKFAQKNNLTEVVGSDAHFAEEIGKAIMLIEPWETPQDFLKNIQKAEVQKSYANPLGHLKTYLQKKKWN